MTSAPLRVAIISANWGVKCHLPAWRAVDGVEVVAICTSREATATAAAAANQVPRAFWDFQALAADPDIDLIDVGTRPALRYHMLKAALGAGKHVYAGVPFAANAAQAEELVGLAAANGVKGATDAYFQHIPAHLELKRRLDAGEIGEVLSVAVDLQINLFNPPRPNYSYYWFADRAFGASVLRNLGSHSLTLLTSLLGDVTQVVGRQALKMETWRSPEHGEIRSQVPDTAAALLQFRKGPIATLNLSWIDAGATGWRLDVHGAKGRLTAQHLGRFPNAEDVTLHLATADDPIGVEVPISRDFTHAPYVGIDHRFDPRPSYPMALSFHGLKRAIDGLGGGAPSLEQGLHVERIIDAIVRSEQSGAWEAVAPLDTRVHP